MNSNEYEFSAPQHIYNLENAAINSENDVLDSYFSVLERTPRGGAGEASGESGGSSPKEVFQTPLQTPMEKAGRVIAKAARRTLTGATPLKDVSNLGGIGGGTFEGIPLLGSSKKHPMRTRKDSEEEALSLRSRAVKRETFCYGSGSGAPPLKYVSLAEALLHFHMDTPPRFKSSKTKSPPNFNRRGVKVKATVPLTPNLETKKRARLSHAAPPPPLEDYFSHIPKINPLNPKVFKKPKPFLKTELPAPKPFLKPKTPPKKEVAKPKEEEPFVFKARPVPKSVLAPQPLIIRVPVGTGKEGESSVRLVAMEAPKIGPGIKPIQRKNTDLMAMCEAYERAKEARRKKWEEEERKKKELSRVGTGLKAVRSKNSITVLAPTTTSYNRARELAAAKKQAEEKKAEEEGGKQEAGGRVSSIPHPAHSSKENRDEFHFKARAPSVLQRKPFEPKKAERAPIETKEFNLMTERRLKEREERKKGASDSASHPPLANCTRRTMNF